MTTPGVGPDPRDESVGALLSDLSADLSTLVRQEIALAKVELAAKGKETGKGVGMLAGAGVIGLAMLGLAMEVWVAALIVTVVWAVVAAVLVQMGRKQLKEAGPPKPEQTIETIKEDVQWAKTQMQSDTTSS
jgi:type IV secretory pathway TrbD component